MSGKDNLTAVLYGINDLRLEQRPIPKPKPDQVLIQMECVGICGSDVHYLVDGKIGPYVVQKPMVIGHEAAGTIVECGSEVTHLVPGDRVAIEPGVPCGICTYCKTGVYNLCPKIFFCATPPDDGNLARYYVHSAAYCYKLPENMDFEEGTLMEPLAVAVHSCKRAHVALGHVVLVMGAGPIGLCHMMAAKAFGASKVAICDQHDIKLEIAKKLGADVTLKIVPEMTEFEIGQRLTCRLGDEPNKTFECAGSEILMRVAMNITKVAGTIILVGMGAEEPKMPIQRPLFNEVDIRGGFRYCNDYPEAMEMVRSGKINVKPLVTHRFKLEDTLKAFDTVKNQEGDPIKVMIFPNPNWKPPS